MVRRLLKLVSLGAVTLSVSAISATPGSSAAHFHAEEAPVTFKGSKSGPNPIAITVESGNISCTKGGFTGSSVNKTDEALTITPQNFTECSFRSLFDTVEMNGCDFVLHADGKFDIAGAQCGTNPIYFGTYPFCSVTIGPQNGLKALTYGNVGTGKGEEISIEMKVNGIAYTQDYGCAGGPFFNGVLAASFLMKGETSKGVQQGIWLE